MSRDGSDFAAALRISTLTFAHKSKKIRVAGRLKMYDLEHSMLVIEDDQTPLLIDISLCLNGDTSYQWLRECNTVVMAIGYLDIVEMVLDNDTETVPTLILRALVTTERRDLNLDVWNKAIDSYHESKIKPHSATVST